VIPHSKQFVAVIIMCYLKLK